MNAKFMYLTHVNTKDPLIFSNVTFEEIHRNKGNGEGFPKSTDTHQKSH